MKPEGMDSKDYDVLDPTATRAHKPLNLPPFWGPAEEYAPILVRCTFRSPGHREALQAMRLVGILMW